MYVGITRAQRYLTISYAKTRQRYGDEQTCEPSRFLEELPNKYLDWDERKQTSPEDLKKTADAYISNLTAMLDDL